MAAEHERGESYEVAAGPGQPRPAAKPESQKAVPPPILAYQGKGQEKTFVPEALINRQAPMALLAGGLVVHFTAAAWQASPGGWARSFGAVGIELMASTGLMLACVFVAARVRGFKLGALPNAILKLMAISVAPAAAMMLLSWPLSIVPLGFLVNWGIGFCLYFALLGVFFDLDQEDTWLCVLLIFVTNLCVNLALRYGVSTQ